MSFPSGYPAVASTPPPPVLPRRMPTGPSLPLAGRCVVFLHAHPDDEAIFTGATMRALADRGARVVLVTATGGELGEPVPTPPGGSLSRVRVRELERAAAELGVARLVLLGRRDSGMSGWAANAHPDALAAAGPPGREELARRLARLCERERADALVHYDSDGIYRHPDHLAVHQIGQRAATLAGITGYQATVDREHLHLTGEHLVDRAARDQSGQSERSGPSGGSGGYGRVTVEIGLAIVAGPAELAAKRAAMAAHASQIPARVLDDPAFEQVYRLEWYLRDGPRSTLELLGNGHAIR